MGHIWGQGSGSGVLAQRHTWPWIYELAPKKLPCRRANHHLGLGTGVLEYIYWGTALSAMFSLASPCWPCHSFSVWASEPEGVALDAIARLPWGFFWLPQGWHWNLHEFFHCIAQWSLSVKHSSSSGCICIVSEPSGLRTKGQGCLKRSSCHYTMVFSQDSYISMNAHTSIVCHYAYDTSATTSMIDTESICWICTLMIPAHWAVCTCVHIYIRIPEWDHPHISIWKIW